MTSRRPKNHAMRLQHTIYPSNSKHRSAQSERTINDDKPQRGLLRALVLALLFVGGGFESNQAVANEKSTQDLSFLVGSWSVTWTYAPGHLNERTITGSLGCEFALNDQHIFCNYYFDRADQPPIVEHVYYNYNEVSSRYEAIWISGTWPVKVLMLGELTTDEERILLRSAAQFEIADNDVEQVRSDFSFLIEGDRVNRFRRDTYIRVIDGETNGANVSAGPLSDLRGDAESDWTHHMTTFAMRVN